MEVLLEMRINTQHGNFFTLDDFVGALCAAGYSRPCVVSGYLVGAVALSPAGNCC